jgi:hypothetical protein
MSIHAWSFAASALAAALIAGAGASVAPAAASPPDFAPNPSAGWFAYARAFMRPDSGPGPVRPDPTHPTVSNDEFRATGKQPTYAMGDPNSPILKPWAADAIRRYNARVLSGENFFSLHATCRPIGVTAFLLQPMTRPMYIVQGRREVAMILESFNDVRHIYLSARHRANLKPSWNGDSIGHYEGDTLVVDTIGFNDKTVIDQFQTPHTTELHTVERFHLVDGGKTLEVDLHVEDPGAFTTPWNAVQRYRQFEATLSKKKTLVNLAALATPDKGPLMEAICAENPITADGSGILPIPEDDHPAF